MKRLRSIPWITVLGAAGLVPSCNVYTEELLQGTDVKESGTGGARNPETGGSPPTGGAPTGGTRETGGSPGAGAPPTGGKAAGSGGGGSTSVPTGGAEASGGAATGGESLTTGGAPSETGGAPTGSAGDAPAGGAAAGGASDGGTTGGAIVVGPGYTVIDLVDAANNSIELADGEGYWYTLHDDMGGTISPDTQDGSEELVATDLPEARGTSLLGMHVVADSGFDDWGAGLGFDLDSPNSNTKNKYDVSRYSSLVFWARSGNGTFDMRVNIQTAEVVDDGKPGGECAADCDDAYGVDITLEETWQEYTVPLTAPPLAQGGWGASPDFEPRSVLSVQFQAKAGVAFDIWLDDVQFFTE